MTFRTRLLITVALCFCIGMLEVLAGGKGSSSMDCNAQAAGKSGAERDAIIEACMARNNSTAPVTNSAPASSQQDNKGACQAEAQSLGLQGSERQTFMADCLAASGGN